MPDKKISQLTGGGAAAASDKFVVARGGANFSIEGTAVAAAATSVGTLTSLAVTGNLTVDTNTLFVDATNNRVGVGTTSPSVPLEVTGNALLSGVSGYKNLYFNSSIESNSRRFAKIGKNYENTGVDAYDLGIWASTNTAGQTAATVFYRDITTESMRIDGSGNLGLGVTPSAWNSSYKAIDVGNSLALIGSSSAADLYFNAYIDSGSTFRYRQTATASAYSLALGQHRWFNAPSGTAGNAITFTTAMTLDTSGNLGIGTTSPSTYGRLAVLSGATANTAYFDNTAGSAYSSSAFFANSALTLRSGANATGNATAIRLASGVNGAMEGLFGLVQNASAYGDFVWQSYNGTYGERMRLDSSGNLGIGTASPATRLDVNGATTLRGNVTFVADATYDIGASGANRPRNIYTSADAILASVRVGRGAGAVSTNTAVGANALNLNTTGSNNTAVGINALRDNLTGTLNTALGSATLTVNTGTANVAVGTAALNANTTGGSNTAVGVSALNANTIGDVNTAVGSSAMELNTTGAFNTAVGHLALGANPTTSNNTAVGYFALKVSTAADNTAVGASALLANTTGTNNTAIGRNALAANTTANGSTAVGRSALALSTATLNTAVGASAMAATTSGGLNTAVGASSLITNTTGTENVAVGVSALSANTTGTLNVAIGNSALATSSTTSRNTAVGSLALAANTAADNTALGYFGLNANTTGAFNVAVGRSALAANTTASNNTAVGGQALAANTTGIDNTAMGRSALAANTTAGDSTAFGSQALVASTGASNTGVGRLALLSNTTGASNTAIGALSGYGDGTQANTTGSNNTFIGNNAMGAAATDSNVITLGNSAIATLRCQVTTITALSDARDKTDIAPIPAGLAFVNALNPVSFVWNMRDGGKVGVPEFGFIAQQLQAAQAEQGVTVPNLVSTSNPDKLEASAGTLIPILTKAIQELAAQNAALTARIAALEAK